jgi:hypothetical protein
MRKSAVILLVLSVWLGLIMSPSPAKAEDETMQKIYLVPIEQIGNDRGPKYFCWQDGDTDCIQDWGGMDYGFVPSMLIVARNISQAQHDALILNADVYAFPDNLDQSIPPNTLNAFFEGINLPTDWLTSSTTYRELLRYTIGMFQFNQRYSGIAANETGQARSIFDNGRTLDSSWNSLSAQEKTWFNATIQSFQPGAPAVTGNPKLRTLAKRAGDLWGARPAYIGGVEL